jgi:CRP-like cAMP-binding protein
MYDSDHMAASHFDDADFAAMPESLKSAATRHDYARGESLFMQGAQPVALFYVLSGEVRLTRPSVAGGEAILQRTRRGFLAEASMTSPVYHCNGVAAETSSVLRFPVGVFRHALQEDAAFCSAWIAGLSRELRRSRAQCECLALKGAAARVLYFLENLGDHGRITLTQSRKIWAAELGLTHEVLYRTLARLEREGAIVIEGNTIQRIGC